MRAMALLQPVERITPGEICLAAVELPDPEARAGELLLRVRACGICHTELDEIEGRLTPPELPRVLGHQVVGEVVAMGSGVSGFEVGQRVGVGWIAGACGECRFCRSDRENLCAQFRGAGYHLDGGYAEKMRVNADYAFVLPDALDDVHTAPLLCAGAIGFRALRLARLRNGETLGLMGFGASAHLVLQMAKQLYPRSPVLVFARHAESRQFALSLGADWAGNIEDLPPNRLDAAIDTTPAWRPIIAALQHLAPGGRLVINAIRKESGDQAALQNMDYASHLWMEKEVQSVANITRRDIQSFLALAAEIELRVETKTFALSQANEALWELKTQRVRGAKVLLNP